ncbi:MAG: glutamate--tRNA ligase, partial [Lentisphaeria bacterium]|nr:glutamate--tRNA ligase [Lentisphaeria bacterium]
MNSVRVRFAPSPTGHVHIGNIRAAIFNWLYARHAGGAFLLRVEDTDLERSTPEAIATLHDIMQWLGLDYDEEPLRQTTQRDVHTAAAERLVGQGAAYLSAKGGEGQATLFRIPWAAEALPGVSEVGEVEVEVHPDVPVRVSGGGVNYAGVSRKGKPIPDAGCLAGFQDLRVLDADGNVLFEIGEHLDTLLSGAASFDVDGAAQLRFTRRQIAFDDLVKGRLAKPLDSMRDFVIVRSDGSPVFHLANVCDDISQGITHIVRGDDHVENTYRHLFLFAALEAAPPIYGHLPMIVNERGKPYSKRDGDAFVGDFRDKGYLPEALFNYLTLLGWSPGDDREKLTRAELVSAFTLDRVQRSAAQMDIRKMQNLNGQYMAALSPEVFAADAHRAVQSECWCPDTPDEMFLRVASLMQSRTKLFPDVGGWRHFFEEIPEYDDQAVRKVLRKESVPEALEELFSALENVCFDSVSDIEAALL